MTDSTSPTPAISRRTFAQAGIAAAGATAMTHLAATAQDSPPIVPTGQANAERVDQAISQIPAIAQDLLDRSGVPGMSVAVVFDDAIAYSGGFGVRELGNDAPVSASTVFQLASVSKSIAGTVVSMMVSDGTVEWDSRMSDLDPAFALSDPWVTREVTLADLFTHRSGLPDHAGDVLEDLGYDRDEVIRRLRHAEPEASFRSKHIYTNFGLTAAAVAAAGTTGLSWEDYSDQRLYQPLGMTHTSSRFSEYMAQRNRAIPHMKTGDTWAVTSQQRDPDPQSPAGGVSSNATDLAQWMRLQLLDGMFEGKELISAEALAPMHLPQSVSNIPTDPGTEHAGFYGLGINVSYDNFGAIRWGHSGAFLLGAATAFFMLPASGFGVLALTNGSPVGVPEAFCLSVLDLVQLGEVSGDWLDRVTPSFEALTKVPYDKGIDWTTPPDDASDPLDNAAYMGTYHNEYYGDVEVALDGETLVLVLGPNRQKFPLTHYDRDSFSWQPAGENATVRSGITFNMSATGRSTDIWDDYLAAYGPGLLPRVS
jgi:CubicO group peptidase (beta-lactamase class C family)